MQRRQLTEFFFRRVIGPHYIWVTLLSLLVTGVAVWTVATQWNIDSDFKSLLPRDSDAFLAMEEVSDRVGSGSALFVVIDSPDTEANKEFAEAFARELRGLDQVALAHFHNDKAFFEEHQLLYLKSDDLETLKERIGDKIKDEKRRANPLFVSLGEPGDDDEGIETDDLRENTNLKHEDYKEYLISDDGYSLTIVVRFVESSTSLEATQNLISRVETLGEQLDPTKYHEDMYIEYGGGLVRRQQQYNSIVDDVQSSAIFTIVGLFLVIALYFRRTRAVMVVLTPLVMGVVWTLALAFPIFGALNTISAFIFAILLGLGIDFSIHLLSGYDHAREEGLDPVEALIQCYTTIGSATVIGASTTLATFIIISFAQFRGLSQFGKVASIGVVSTLVAMIVVLPALVLTFQRIWPHEPSPDDEGAPLGSFFRRLSPAHWFEDRHASTLTPLFLTAAAALTVLSAWQITNLEFEENFHQVGEIQWPWQEQGMSQEQIEARTEKDARRAAWRMRSHAESIRAKVAPDSYVPSRKQRSVGAKYTSAVSGNQSSTPTILLFDDADDARDVYRRMEDAKRAGELETIRSVAAIYAFMPEGEEGMPSKEAQEQRMEVISSLDAMLEDENLTVLGEKDRERVEQLQERLDVSPFTIYDLPLWTKRLFKEAGPEAKSPTGDEQFAFEYLIYVNEAVNTMIGAEARQFLAEITDIKEASGNDFRIASQSYVYVAMLDEIKYDGALMMSIAIGIVFLILSFAFRGPHRGLIAMVPLIFGAFWMFGLSAFIGLRLDFFNVVIIPVVIGLGVDDGVHFYYNYLDRGRGSIGTVMRNVGTAVWMTSITSMIGFGGLAITDDSGLQSIGSLAIIGISTTLLATLLLMPAILWLGEKYDIGWLVGEV
ncbi:MAG: efflux RND transporter permease subunit [Myxococcota bacterium]